MRYRGYRTDSIRLDGWDYRRSAWYFLTICTQKRIPFFGNVRRGIVGLSRIGCIAHRFWAAIPDHFNRARLDAFVIMPDHVHGLIGLVPDGNAVETLNPTSLRNDANQGDTDINQRMSSISPKPGSISTIIRSYKSAVTRWARRNGCPGFAWQPRFYDHIVRNQRAFRRIRRYIVANPVRWHQDRQHVC
jgi:REP element-mobilizing transposase RayT